jgi:hypothetical protein
LLINFTEDIEIDELLVDIAPVIVATVHNLSYLPHSTGKVYTRISKYVHVLFQIVAFLIRERHVIDNKSRLDLVFWFIETAAASVELNFCYQRSARQVELVEDKDIDDT